MRIVITHQPGMTDNGGWSMEFDNTQDRITIIRTSRVGQNITITKTFATSTTTFRNTIETVATALAGRARVICYPGLLYDGDSLTVAVLDGIEERHSRWYLPEDWPDVVNSLPGLRTLVDYGTKQLHALAAV